MAWLHLLTFLFGYGHTTVVHHAANRPWLGCPVHWCGI